VFDCQDVADDEYEEEQELADEFDSDFNDEVLVFVQSQYILSEATVLDESLHFILLLAPSNFLTGS